jgi:apolipoprotein N-acyltransferase
MGQLMTRLRVAVPGAGRNDAWRIAAAGPARDAALAALSGVLYASASPGLGLWPLALLCWVPFIVVLPQRTCRQAARLGLIQGMASSLVATSWIFGAARTLTGWSVAPSLAVASLLWLYQSGRIAVLGWLVARAERRGWPLGLSFGLSLAAVEVAYPMLFGWQSAIQVHDVPLLMQAADLGGPILVSLALAGANVAVAKLVLARIDRRKHDVRRLVPAALCPVLLVAYGAIRVPLVDRHVERASKANVGVVQANLGLRRVRAGRVMKQHRDATAELAAQSRLDLVVWPETAVHTAYEARDLSIGLTSSIYEGAPAGRLPPILTGVNVRETDASGALLPPSNSAVLVDPRAGVLGRYDKNRLVPFGEYVPFGDVWPALYDWFPHSGPVTAGTTASPIAFGDHRIGVLICYEDIFPAYTNAVVRQTRPDLLINLTNDGWFGRTEAAGLHFALSKFRAVEHRRFLVRAGNNGMSALIDPAGRVIRQSPSYVQATVAGEVAWMQGSTLYEAIGDAPWWVSALAIVAMGAVPAASLRRRARSSPGQAGAETEPCWRYRRRNDPAASREAV